MGKQEIAITVDSVILCSTNNQFKVLLIKRKKDPFKDQWALPGGFIEEGEDLEQAAKRELLEETGVKIHSMEQIRAFGKPGRDPRGRMISIAFLSRIFSEEALSPGDDAKDAAWFEINDLPELAFDHNEIITAARGLL
ncbi:NUDIX hydrolase [Autumnicola edwardsiae]|uniref:NUDIX hydrolase n=1 Tax=Autumnicola edwardsiae TaxID=3075594 RepID=A0ABU3CTT5_9FLAO|nr:NUDIX hydrolase [Zunongwangia sp. F297]MDT0649330.1 NUDIX hydrolase [Zunongwangia sp. F297]